MLTAQVSLPVSEYTQIFLKMEEQVCVNRELALSSFY